MPDWCAIVSPVESGRVQVMLDVEREGVPIRGSLSVGPEIERRFHGWLELADALEAARAGGLRSGAVAADLGAAQRPAVVRIG